MFQENCLQCILTRSPNAIIDGELSFRCKVRSKEVVIINSTFSCHNSFLLLELLRPQPSLMNAVEDGAFPWNTCVVVPRIAVLDCERALQRKCCRTSAAEESGILSAHTARQAGGLWAQG